MSQNLVIDLFSAKLSKPDNTKLPVDFDLSDIAEMKTENGNLIIIKLDGSQITILGFSDAIESDLLKLIETADHTLFSTSEFLDLWEQLNVSYDPEKSFNDIETASGAAPVGAPHRDFQHILQNKGLQVTSTDITNTQTVDNFAIKIAAAPNVDKGINSNAYVNASSNLNSNSSSNAPIINKADAPALTTSDSSGKEDTAISLNIKAALTDLAEILSIVIDGVPTGATLSAGTNDGQGRWILNQAELNGLTITPAANDSSSFYLTVTAISQSGQLSATTKSTIFVSVEAVADIKDYSDSKSALSIDFTTGVVSGKGVKEILGGEIEGVIGSAYKDKIIGDFRDNIISGGAGNDVIHGGAGNDTLSGDGGNDTLSGDNGDDILNGGDGNDKLYGDDGNDTVNGENGNDMLYGGNGNDILNGGDGNDKLYGDDGNDTLNGDGGNDILKGGSGNDILNGGDGNDKLYGDDGNDTLNGGLGNDFLYGGNGDDVISGGEGKNIIDGGKGNDTVDYSNADTAITLDLSKGIATDSAGNKIIFDSIKNVENATGSDFDDTIKGDKFNNILNGGKGSDQLTGGAGADTFVLSDPDGGIDVITDFDFSSGDRLDISSLIDLNEGESLSDYISIVETDGNTHIHFDSDGAGGPSTGHEIATLQGVVGLEVSSIFTSTSNDENG